MKKSIPVLLAVILVLTLCLSLMCACTPADSNGVEVFGLYATDNYPIEITNLDYTLNVRDFPWTGWGVSSYYSNFEINYVLHNSTNSDCTMTLYTPHMFPSYCNIVDPMAIYEVTVDGEAVDSTYRYAMNSAGGGSANFTDCFASIRNRKVSDVKYNSQLKVFKQSYRIIANVTPVQMKVTLKASEKVFLGEGHYNDSSSFGKRTLKYYNNTEGESILDVYSVGAPLSNQKGCVSFDKPREYGEGSISVTYLSCEELTFDDLATSCYDENRDVSEVDYYNAVVDKIRSQGGIDCSAGLKQFDVYSELVAWQMFQLTVPSQGDVGCVVSGPLFPKIYESNSNDVFSYEIATDHYYRFSGVSAMNVRVVTEYTKYYQDDKFEVDKPGYIAHYDDCSNASISLYKSNEKGSGGSISNFGRNFLITFIVLMAFFFVVVPVTVVIIVVVVTKRKCRNNEQLTTDNARVTERLEDWQTTAIVSDSDNDDKAEPKQK